MQPIPSDVSGTDVWQWLNNGWFQYQRDDGTYVPARIESPESRDQFVIWDVEDNTYDWDRRRAYPHWPVCGAINLDGYAIIATRRPVQQYRRTYNSRCIVLTVPRKWDVMKKHYDAQRLNPDDPKVIKAVFNPVYYNYDRALQLLDEGWVSVALNPHLIVAGVPEEQLVYYRGKLLARVHEGELQPMDSSNPRNIRILKWFNGRVRYAHRTI